MKEPIKKINAKVYEKMIKRKGRNLVKQGKYWKIIIFPSFMGKG